MKHRHLYDTGHDTTRDTVTPPRLIRSLGMGGRLVVNFQVKCRYFYLLSNDCIFLSAPCFALCSSPTTTILFFSPCMISAWEGNGIPISIIKMQLHGRSSPGALI
jgi:hypothetical protein